ncbi:MAG TPA: alpha/beta hydrolase fold domain-containing protein [Opitutaceae bacterium]|nr:alpha/beta hydrolase fold domain-containing protein [Opitutaceae bacterium]
MHRHLLLLFAVFSVLLGLLTAVLIPRWLDWRAGLLAGEYGHWVALAALAAAAGAVALREGRPIWAAATVALGLAGAGLLLKPAFQAWRIGRVLPAELGRAFGVAPRVPVFSPVRLFSFAPRRAASETLAYARGLEFDFYRPRGAAPAPCVVMIHSGDRRELAAFDAWLVSRGCAVAAIDYRLAPAAPWPAPREDVRAAVSYLRARSGSLPWATHAFEYNLNGPGGQLATAAVAAFLDSVFR